MRPDRLVAALLTLLCAVPACRKEAASEARDETRVHVETKPIEERQMPRVLPLTGTLQADVRTELTANATGRVDATFVERGQHVEEGAALVQLDIRSARISAAEAKANVESARTQLEAARADCARYDALLARGAVTQQEYDKQVAQCKQQKASVAVSKARSELAALNVGDGTIRAPFSGVVTERAVSVGDYVQPSSKVVTLVVSDPLRLNLTVPERRIPDAKVGSPIYFSTSAVPERVFTGSVKYTSGEVRPLTRDLVAEAIVPNPDGALMPGMFVNVNLVAGQEPRPVVPKSAIFQTGNDKSIFVVKNRTLFLRIVKVGVAQDDVVALEEGAKKGEIVVLHPTEALSDGQAVD
jgi:membrane fusion protein (multidrug efflux system)